MGGAERGLRREYVRPPVQKLRRKPRRQLRLCGKRLKAGLSLRAGGKNPLRRCTREKQKRALRLLKARFHLRQTVLQAVHLRTDIQHIQFADGSGGVLLLIKRGGAFPRGKGVLGKFLLRGIVQHVEIGGTDLPGHGKFQRPPGLFGGKEILLCGGGGVPVTPPDIHLP